MLYVPPVGIGPESKVPSSAVALSGVAAVLSNSTVWPTAIVTFWG